VILTQKYSFLNSSNVSASSGLNITNQLRLHGSVEQTAKFERLGRRFIPKNVGYALVVSGLADMFVTRLSRSKKMVGYQMVPNEDIPLDVNTITFLINPAYTMNGSLDGMTGSQPASDRFFQHVPDAISIWFSLSSQVFPLVRSLCVEGTNQLPGYPTKSIFCAV
jgi:hypothetical protein